MPLDLIGLSVSLNQLVPRLGVAGTLKLVSSRRRLRAVLPERSSLSIREEPHPFHFRHGTSDKHVIVEIFVNRQYACLLGQPAVRTIIDAGANVGAASVYLLNRYPDARVIAIEPDQGNYAVLCANLAPYGGRAIPVHAALWPRDEGMRLERGGFRDGAAWSFQVRPLTNGEAGEVRGVSVTTLLKEHDITHVDILKIDIEGAERELFAARPLTWLERVSTVAIELHDSRARDVFLTAIREEDTGVERHGELTVWRRPHASAQTDGLPSTTEEDA